MLMMRLQRVGRKNDPSYRIVVTDKRTGPKSNKHIAILGSYNPKMDHIQLDAEAAKVWLSKGVQPSDTVHNILVGQKVIEGKKINVLPRKSPIVDEAAIKKAEEEAAAKAEADKVNAEGGEGDLGQKAAAEVSEEQSESDNSEDTQSEVTEAAPATEESTEDTPDKEAPADKEKKAE